jgi:hypothetical protein
MFFSCDLSVFHSHLCFWSYNVDDLYLSPVFVKKPAALRLELRIVALTKLDFTYALRGGEPCTLLVVVTAARLVRAPR